jgi:uncharacterized damage-inducible protein DinB
MNEFVQQHGELFRETFKLREQLMDILKDDDLYFTPGGSNPKLGALLRETGDVERSYIDSIRTLKQDWTYCNNEPGIEESVEKLKAWFKALDDELLALMDSLTNDDLKKIVDRGFPLPVGGQLHAYREAVLIFGGRISVYLKTMGKPLPQQWQWWIG